MLYSLMERAYPITNENAVKQRILPFLIKYNAENPNLKTILTKHWRKREIPHRLSTQSFEPIIECSSPNHIITVV